MGVININKMVAPEDEAVAIMAIIKMVIEVGMLDAVEDHNHIGANREHKQQVLMIPPLERLRVCRL